MTTASSQQMRGIAVGRKDWMSANTDEGARRAAAIRSSVSTRGRFEIEPCAQVEDVLQCLAEGDDPPQLMSPFGTAVRAQSATR